MTAVTGAPSVGAWPGSDDPLDGAFSWTAATLGASVPLANRTCISMCHGDHPHTLTSPATSHHENNVYVDATTQATRGAASATRVGVGGTGTQNRAKTDFDSAANAGLCTSCHQSPSSRAASPSRRRPSAPPLTTSRPTRSAGRPTRGATRLHDGSAFARNCTKCHASRTEGNTPRSSATTAERSTLERRRDLLAGTTNPARHRERLRLLQLPRLDGHARRRRPGQPVRQGHPEDVARRSPGTRSTPTTVHDSVAELASADLRQRAWRAPERPRHSSCMDCHDPHEAKARSGTARTGGRHGQPSPGHRSRAPGALSSPRTRPSGPRRPRPASPRRPSPPAPTSRPPSASSVTPATTGARGPRPRPPRRIRGDRPGKGVQPGQRRQLRGDGLGERRDSRRLPSGPRDAGTNLGATSNVTTPWTRTSLMTCSDCHESDTVHRPNGPHGCGEQVHPQGPNTTWNSSLTAQGGSASCRQGPSA